jgi:hypothetical protein
MADNILKHIIKHALQPLREQLVLDPEPKVEKPKPKSTTKKPTSKSAPPKTATKKPAAPTTPKETKLEKERKQTIDQIYKEIGDDSSGSGTTNLIVGLVAAAAVIGGGVLLKSYLARKGVKGFGSLYKVLGKNVDKLKKITPSELNQFERFIDAELEAGNISKAEHAELKSIVRAEVLASFRNRFVSKKFFEDFSAGRMSYDDFIAGSPEMFRKNPVYRDMAKAYYDDVIVPFYGEVKSTRVGSRGFPEPEVMRGVSAIETGTAKLYPRGNTGWTQIQTNGFNQAGIDYVYVEVNIPLDSNSYEKNILERLKKPIGDSNGIYIPTKYLEDGLPAFGLVEEFKRDLISLGGSDRLADNMYKLLYNRYKMLIELSKYE